MMLFKRGPGFLAQVESSISLEFMLPRIYQIKEKKYSMSNVHTFTFKMGLQKSMCFQAVCLAGNIP